jgi:Uma2 family endonuclease
VNGGEYHGATMAPEAPISEIHRFTVDDLDRMFDVGIVDEDDRIELLDGQLVTKPRESPEHQLAVGHVHRALSGIYSWSDGYWIRLGATTSVDEFSLPEPDLSIVTDGLQRFATRHPRGDEVLLTVEVSLATVARDRGQKAAIYARAACPVYWILDLPRRELVVHSEPREDGSWASLRTHRSGDLVDVPGTGIMLDIVDLLPPAL